MSKKSNSIIKIIFVVLLLIIVFVIGLLIGKKTNSLKSNINSISDIKQIRLTEDISKSHTIENLDNVIFSNAMISQYDNEMEISINLGNSLETEKVEARTLTVNLLDKEGKIILTKDVEMEEISDNYGHIFLDLKFEIDEPIIIYDIQIIAK